MLATTTNGTAELLIMEKMCHRYILILEGGFAPEECTSGKYFLPRETTLVPLNSRRDAAVKAFLIITNQKFGEDIIRK